MRFSSQDLQQALDRLESIGVALAQERSLNTARRRHDHAHPNASAAIGTAIDGTRIGGSTPDGDGGGGGADGDANRPIAERSPQQPPPPSMSVDDGDNDNDDDVIAVEEEATSGNTDEVVGTGSAAGRSVEGGGGGQRAHAGCGGRCNGSRACVEYGARGGSGGSGGGGGGAGGLGSFGRDLAGRWGSDG